MQSIFTTKTFWVNGLAGLAAILSLPEVSGLIPPQHVKYVIAAQAIIAILMRRFTKSPATFTAPVTGV